MTKRVTEIRHLTEIQSWKHVPESINIADMLSRSYSSQKMPSSEWWEGPSWLKENPKNWPAGEIYSQPKEVDAERKNSKTVNTHFTKCALFRHLNNNTSTIIEPHFDSG